MKVEWIVDRRGEAGTVLDQGQRPTCLSCAASTAHGSMAGEPKSIEFLHHTSRTKPGGLATLSAVRAVLAEDGQPPEDQWPYDPSITDSDATPPVVLPGPFAKAEVDVKPDVDPAKLTGFLQNGELPVVGLLTTRRFMVLTNAILTEPDTLLDGHAVLLVGAATYRGKTVGSLTDGDTLMCVQNSWGPSWGVGGYGLVGPQAWRQMALVCAVLTPLSDQN